MPKLIARWNPARDAWETETTGLFCEHSDVYSGTWPTSGMTRDGVAYELPTSVHHTGDSGSSSLLGTPRTADGVMHDLRDSEVISNPRGRLKDQIAVLLPTPRATDGTKGGPNQRGSSGDLMLPSAVQLLPTPRSQNGEARNQTIWPRDLTQPQNLENALARIGGSTGPQSDDGNDSPDVPPRHLLTRELEADSA